MIKNKRPIIFLLTAAAVLAIPLAAMQFSDSVNWSGFDFAVIGALFFGSALACELVLRKVHGTRNRIAAIAAVLAVCFLIWVELAVGILGTPLSGS